MTGDAERRKRRKAAEAAAVSVEPTGATEAPEPPAAPDNSPEREVEPAAPDAQALATGAAARRRRAWCPTAQEPSTINHYHGCHRRRLRSSSPRPRSDLVPRLSSLQRTLGEADSEYVQDLLVCDAVHETCIDEPAGKGASYLQTWHL